MGFFSWPPEKSPAPSIPGDRGNPWEQSPPRGAIQPALRVSKTSPPPLVNPPQSPSHSLTNLATLGAPDVTHFPHFPLGFKTNQNETNILCLFWGIRERGKQLCGFVLKNKTALSGPRRNQTKGEFRGQKPSWQCCLRMSQRGCGGLGKKAAQ